MSVTATLANFVALTQFEVVSAAAIEAAQRGLLGKLGVTVRARKPVAEKVVR